MIGVTHVISTLEMLIGLPYRERQTPEGKLTGRGLREDLRMYKALVKAPLNPNYNLSPEAADRLARRLRDLFDGKEQEPPTGDNRYHIPYGSNPDNPFSPDSQIKQ